MSKFNVRLTRRDGLTMVADVDVEASTEEEARKKALEWGADEENECEWSEEDGGGGVVEIEYVAPVKEG